MVIDDRIAAVAESASGRSVVGSSVVSGGDFAASFRLELDDGTRLFAKTHAQPPPHHFTTEAAGLAWLREAGALAVPHVVAASDGDEPVVPPLLILEWVDERRSAAPDEAAFGAALARLHDAGAPCFGRVDRRTTGSRGLPNDPCATWSEFAAERRLLPLARMARDTGALPTSTIVRLERLANSLHAFDDGEPPSRLHGDLWAGNRLVDASGRSWLVDPAAHGGHREFDLAMMRLFGGFGAAAFDAYHDVHPLREGWRDRVQLHQIAPLVVHAVKFGRSYVDAARAAIDRY